MKNVSQVVTYYAYNISTGAYTTGDSANHTLRGMQDATEFTPAASPSEVDSTNLKGAYKVSIAATENIGNLMLLGGVSSTANVQLIPARWSNDPIPGVVRSGVATAGAASTITLDANASATNSIYNGCRVAIVAGTGVGQGDRIITGYVGSTQVATVDTAWTTNPDSTSVFVIIPAAADLRTVLGTLSKGTAGAVASDQAQIQNPTATVDLSGTTIATVTNLTNAPTAGDLTATMKASVTTAATAATPTAAAVTAAVTVGTNNDKTGYALSGSALSAIQAEILSDSTPFPGADIDAAVSSRAPASTALSTAQWTNTRATKLDDLDATISSVIAAIAALNNVSSAQVKAQVVAALSTDTYAEPGQGTPTATIDIATKIGYLYKALINQLEQTATSFTLFNNAGSTVDQKATVSDDGTTFERTKLVSGP